MLRPTLHSIGIRRLFRFLQECCKGWIFHGQSPGASSKGNPQTASTARGGAGRSVRITGMLTLLRVVAIRGASLLTTCVSWLLPPSLFSNHQTVQLPCIGELSASLTLFSPPSPPPPCY
jgi:hypothetical protein